MAHGIEDYLEVATTIRQDFEAGRITDDDLISAGVETNQALLAGTVFAHGKTVFPQNYCTYATLLLMQRLGEGKPIEGIYRIDPESGFDGWHMFLGIGSTALGADTIIDITADQFSGGVPVYVGPLVLPWSRVPNFEEP